MMTAALFDCRAVNLYYGTSYTVEQLEAMADIDIQEAIEVAVVMSREAGRNG